MSALSLQKQDSVFQFNYCNDLNRRLILLSLEPFLACFFHLLSLCDTTIASFGGDEDVASAESKTSLGGGAGALQVMYALLSEKKYMYNKSASVIKLR